MKMPRSDIAAWVLMAGFPSLEFIDGASFFNNSSRLAKSSARKGVDPVTLPPGMRKAVDKTQGDEIGANRHDDRNRV